ncbi:MAG: ABC transporter ATP-binding protein [Microbacteriaceae bacterium]|nr:ABC transporter ATP-binding protein [Microbacteriaceae bacterium]
MTTVLDFKDVSFVRGGRKILDGLTWQVDSAERWVVLGPNGAGKSTILKIAGFFEYPTSGTVEILGNRLGRVDVFEVRSSVGFAASTQERRIPATETVLDCVLTAAHSVTGRWREKYDSLDERRAARVLAEWGLSDLADRQFGSLSDGERKRVLIARAVMTDPELLLLDEPAASVDLGGRELLLQTLAGFAQSPYCPGMIMVTHHVEEIPPGFSHALLLGSDGRVQAQGRLEDVLTSQHLSAAFGVPLEITQQNGRFFSYAV